MRKGIRSLTAKPLHVLENLSSKRKGKIQLRRDHESPEGEWVYGSTLSLISALDGVSGQRHVPVALSPGERPGTHCTGGWVGHRAGLDRCGKSRPPPGSDPGPSSP